MSLRDALNRAHLLALVSYEEALDQRGSYKNVADALRAYRANVADTADEKANAGEWFYIEKGDALEFFDDLVRANKGSTPTNRGMIKIPLHSLGGDEITEMPRSSFTQEEFDSLDKWVQSEIHINDPKSAKRIDGMASDIINRIDWIDEWHDDDDSDYFSDGLAYAVKQPDFLDTVPDPDGNIGDLINKYGPLLGAPRVEEVLLSYLGDADEYEKSHDDYYNPSQAGYFQIGITRDFYIGSGDIRGLEDAYPDEIRAALEVVEDARPYMVDELKLTVELLLGIKAGGDYQADLDPTSSFGYTPNWDSIVERVEDELNEELPDEPLSSDDPRTYEERKIYTFNDGSYWVELTTEELPAESQALGHCVGDLEHGYPQGVRNKELVVYSLRTPSGRSKLTAAFYLNRDGVPFQLKDLRGKANRLAGWAAGEAGESRVKWMEVQKVGKLLEVLGLDVGQDALASAHEAMGRLGGQASELTQNPASFAWHCPSPPPQHEEAALAETDYGIVDYIHEHAEEITPDEFAEAVGGWDVVIRDWYGGFASSGDPEDDAAFARKDWSVTWYRSHYPDGTPVVFHTASGIEHVYEEGLEEMGDDEEGPACWQPECDVVVCEEGVDEFQDNPPRSQPVNPKLVAKARKTVLAASKRLYGNVAGLSQLNKIPITYNGRLTRLIGRAHTKITRPISRSERMLIGMGMIKTVVPVKPTHIEITGKWELSDEVLYHTLVHELCHSARAIVAKNFLAEDGHGRKWQKLMEECGEVPDPYCSVPEIGEQMMEAKHKKRAKKQQAHEDAVAGKKKATKTKLRIGQTVYFEYKGERATGKVKKLNPTTVGVEQTSAKPMVRGKSGKGLTWKVGYAGVYI